METIYLKGGKVDWATEKFSLKKYFEKFYEDTKVCFEDTNRDSDVNRNSNKTIKNNCDKIFSLTGYRFTDDQLDSLSHSCSPDLLYIDGEHHKVSVGLMQTPSSFEKTIVPSDVDLETFKRLRDKNKLPIDCQHIKQKYQTVVKFNQECKNRRAANLNAGSNFIVSVKVFHPFLSNIESNSQRVSCSQEIILHGEETLDQLKDVIKCKEDVVDAAGDISENPEKLIRKTLKNVYVSSMFFIGNVFYIDGRHSEAVDYSEVIRSWAAKKKISMSRREKMEDTKIKDLVVRFGYPYLYQHLSCCEHLIIFSDARLLLEDDVRVSESYPVFNHLRRVHAKRCFMCRNHVSKKIVSECDRVPQDPCHVCEYCFKLYFYSNSQKIGTFKAYSYFDRSITM